MRVVQTLNNELMMSEQYLVCVCYFLNRLPAPAIYLSHMLHKGAQPGSHRANVAPRRVSHSRSLSWLLSVIAAHVRHDARPLDEARAPNSAGAVVALVVYSSRTSRKNV